MRLISPSAHFTGGKTKIQPVAPTCPAPVLILSSLVKATAYFLLILRRVLSHKAGHVPPLQTPHPWVQGQTPEGPQVAIHTCP